ncbi:ammonium transporter [Mangrovibacterium diazotrophicum]|uniref:Ammonium transporter n=1 Tax=Mangrovibacterium diazotrophicum TaxID=1261403 RepID=A0A419W755_9BACT|nr:ammonium transporter [Mangrovibacterium diazotrophicum]RKD91311.1 ammonium transporter [Mangrovibacterium diazotrophicum]
MEDTLQGLQIGIDNMWLLIAAFMVMFMQPGFAMVEAGFTRSKNTANILMKNMMDFCIGSLLYWAIGFTLMYGDSIGGIIGTPDLFFISEGFGDNYSDYADLFFQTVFAATAATIVSGAMAERTEFISYLIFSIFITLFVYPISGHWTWGGGWLSELGFHDFAGSSIVHSCGGWLGLAGAAIIGPRIGKYKKDGTPNAIPGHNLALGALGVFILWFGWFGFNPGSQLAAAGTDNAVAIGHIAVTTNLAAAAGAVTAMIVAWVRYKRPTLSLTLNGALAGLVAITAGCDAVDPIGAVFIGIIAGFALPFAVEFFDKVLKIDDPVGAVSVHGVCGAIGTLLVGVFSTSEGLAYGHGVHALGIQAIGVLTFFVWAFGTGVILFTILKKIGILRVSARIEEEGLDIYEHGESAYN